MCSIFGVHNLRWSDAQQKRVVFNALMTLAVESCERGRDAMGYAAFITSLDGSTHRVFQRQSFRSIRDTHPDLNARALAVISQVQIMMRNLDAMTPNEVRSFTLIANCRAEPTTEWLQDQREDDIQPYANWPAERYFAVHNGVIANDAQFIPEHSRTKVDSAAIPYAVERGEFESLIGSVASAVYDVETDTLWLARNYRPLSAVCPSFGFHENAAAVVFASERQAITRALIRDGMYTDFHIAANSTWKFNGHHDRNSFFVGKAATTRFDKDPNGGNPESAIVILSGGMDSTVSAEIACRDHTNIVLAHFHYGCRAQTRETEAVTAIHAALVERHPRKTITLKFFDLDFLKQLGGNPLVDDTMEVATGKDGIEYANEWVPFRNGLMVAMMAAYADRWSFGAIYTGANLEEAGAFGDNEKEFFDLMEKAIAIGSKAAPKLVNPLDKLMKHEVAQTGLLLEAPIHLSWSCYHGGELHCGNCGPCQLRRTAFAMIGKDDPVKYMQDAPLVGL